MDKALSQMNKFSSLMWEFTDQSPDKQLSVEAMNFVAKHKIDRSRPIKHLAHGAMVYDLATSNLIGEDMVFIEYFPDNVERKNLVADKTQSLQYINGKQKFLGYNALTFKEKASPKKSNEAFIQEWSSKYSKDPVSKSKVTTTYTRGSCKSLSYKNGVATINEGSDDDLPSSIECRLFGEGCSVPKLICGNVDKGTPTYFITTNKGQFTVYDNNSYMAKDYISAKHEVSAKNCSDINAFKEHLVWCGIEVLKVEEL